MPSTITDSLWEEACNNKWYEQNQEQKCLSQMPQYCGTLEEKEKNLKY